jgi:hypothetical protein
MFTTPLLFALAALTQEPRVPTVVSGPMPDIRRAAEERAVPLPRTSSPRRQLGPFDSAHLVAGAQARVRGSAPSAARPLDGGENRRVHVDSDEDGRHWVRGADYKASFGPDGATFVPFLGSAASRNWPVRLQLAAAQRGAHEVELRTPSVEREEDRITIDHGGVREEYVPGLQGLEQLFVLDSLPNAAAQSGAADLVLELAVETELAPRRDGEGWRFEGPDGGVAYGAAVVLDAAGRRSPSRHGVPTRASPSSCRTASWSLPPGPSPWIRSSPPS